MKKSTIFKTIVSAAFLLLALIPFLFISSCQKEEQLILNSDSVNQLKSGTISTDEIDELILKIENYCNEGILEPGIGNSLISKLQNAKKSLERDNETAATNQLNAVENQLEDLIYEGTIDVSIGEELILDVLIIKGEEWTCGQPFVDPRDGNTYKTVKIGEQCWMAENLAYLPSVSPASSESQTNIHYYVYDYQGNDLAAAKATDNYKIYGVLYNWPAALTACPEGWHLPRKDEWETLLSYLGGETVAGGSMKSIIGWESPNTGATNVSGFSGLPGGMMNQSNFYNINIVGSWWSSTEFSELYSSSYFSYYNSSSLYWGANFKKYGFSVRCVKD